MSPTLLQSYQAWWDASQSQGYFWFSYFNGERHRTNGIDAANFSIMLDILRNERPVYGDHITPMVTTQTEGVGEGEK